jgi:hypothetical protein
MSLFGGPENRPCCCIGGCCEGTELPECITVQLTASCCSTTIEVELCQTGGPPVTGLGETLVKYTAHLPTDWCFSEPVENQFVLNTTIGVACKYDEETDSYRWWIFISDGEEQHTWHPEELSNGLIYPLVLVSCDPLLLTFGGDADCDGDDCAYTWVAACFAPGTMIDTPTGNMAIESLKEGDEVYDRDYKIVMVNAVHKSIANVLLYVKDQNGDDVRVTPEHPFMRENSTDKTIPAGELRNGLELPLNKTVSGVTAHFGEVEVINLSVTGSHTFIANGWAVHNKGNL